MAADGKSAGDCLRGVLDESSVHTGAQYTTCPTRVLSQKLELELEREGTDLQAEDTGVEKPCRQRHEKQGPGDVKRKPLGSRQQETGGGAGTGDGGSRRGISRDKDSDTQVTTWQGTNHRLLLRAETRWRCTMPDICINIP